jgi:hypothetical protein
VPVGYAAQDQSLRPLSQWGRVPDQLAHGNYYAPAAGPRWLLASAAGL